MLVDFARIFTNVERLFRPAGVSAFYPKQVETFVQPGVNLFDHLTLHGSPLFKQNEQSGIAAAGDNTLSFPEPAAGFFIVPIFFSIGHNDPVRNIDLTLPATTNAADPWGRWTESTAPNPFMRVRSAGTDANSMAVGPTPPPYSRGTRLDVIFRAMALNAVMRANLFFLDLPAELMKFDYFRSAAPSFTFNTPV